MNQLTDEKEQDVVHKQPRSSTITEKIESYFLQNDEFDDYSDNKIHDNNINDISDPMQNANNPKSMINLDYEWTFLHTTSYFVSIGFIFGSVLFTTGSFFWIIEDSLSANDFYTLKTIAYFAGGFAYVIGSYFGYHEVINQLYPNNKIRRIWFMIPNKKESKTVLIPFYSALSFLIGAALYQIGVTFDVMKVEFDKYSFKWFALDQLPVFFGGICFLLGGFGEMYINKCWLYRSTKLGWICSWLNGIGGILYFIAGIGSFFDNKTVILILVQVPYLIGSFIYIIGSILQLLMWKLGLFGLCYLPKLNVITKSVNVNKKNIVLYRDIMFIFVYVISSIVAISGISYSFQCKQYRDWIKNFVLAALGSIGIISLGSFIHFEPEQPPFNILLWFLRFYMVWYTINNIIDTYHISGSECKVYGG